MSSHAEPPAFSVRRARWDTDRSALRSVRTLVFVQEQAVPQDLEWDSDDVNAVHLLAVDAENLPIGTARLLATGQIGRMAVVPFWRNQGVGSALLRKTIEIAREPGRPAPFLNAQISALRFYLRRGFEPVGEQFEEAGIPHRQMILGA